MFFCDSFSILLPADEIPRSNRLGLTLWPVSQCSLRSSLRSLPSTSLDKTNELMTKSVLAVFSYLAPETHDESNQDTLDFPVQAFKDAFDEDSFKHPINLVDNRGFCFVLTGKESSPISRARCIALTKVINARPLHGTKLYQTDDLFDLFPVLSQFSLQYPIEAPALSKTTFFPAKIRKFETVSKSNSQTELVWGKQNKLNRWRKKLTQLNDYIYIGSDLICKNGDLLRTNGITHIVNCAATVTQPAPGFNVLSLPMMDGGDEHIYSHMFRAANFIDEAIKQKGKILVHCVEGVSRSVAICCSYLMLKNFIDYQTAYAKVRSIRRVANPNPKFQAQLLQLGEVIGISHTSSCYFSKVKSVPFEIKEKREEIVPYPLYQDPPAEDDTRCFVILHFEDAETLKKDEESQGGYIEFRIGNSVPIEYRNKAHEFAELLSKYLNVEPTEE